MLNKHIFGLILLAVVFGLCFVLIDIFSPVSLGPLQLLAAGLVLGFIVASLAPSLLAVVRSMAMPSRKTEDNKTLYVGNLPFRTTRYELRELFQPYGKIHSARIVIDRATRKPRGYGFVEMDGKGAEKAIHSLNGHTMAGRNLKVSEANDREQPG